MKRFASTLIPVIALMVAGGILTMLSQQGSVPGLLSDPKPLPPEASVFAVTPDQLGPLMIIVVVAGVLTGGIGIGLAVVVSVVDKMYRRSLANGNRSGDS